MLKLVFQDYVDKAIELIKWIKNHSIALGQLRIQQLLCRGAIILILILPVLTHWTTHYLAVHRLLTLEPFIKAMIEFSQDILVAAAGKTREAKTKVILMLSYPKDPAFWSHLVR